MWGNAKLGHRELGQIWYARLTLSDPGQLDGEAIILSEIRTQIYLGSQLRVTTNK